MGSPNPEQVQIIVDVVEEARKLITQQMTKKGLTRDRFKVEMYVTVYDLTDKVSDGSLIYPVEPGALSLEAFLTRARFTEAELDYRQCTRIRNVLKLGSFWQGYNFRHTTVDDFAGRIDINALRKTGNFGPGSFDVLVKLMQHYGIKLSTD